VITFEQFQKNLKAAEVREYFQTLGVFGDGSSYHFSSMNEAADHPG